MPIVDRLVQRGCQEDGLDGVHIRASLQQLSNYLGCAIAGSHMKGHVAIIEAVDYRKAFVDIGSGCELGSHGIQIPGYHRLHQSLAFCLALVRFPAAVDHGPRFI